MRKLLIFLMVALIAVAACARQPAAVNAPTAPTVPAEPEEEPAVQQPSIIKPIPGIQPEIKELLDKSKTRVSSIYYKYRGPETTKTGDNFFEFYVKGTKVKYIPAREIQALDSPESYDVIFIDNTAKTAVSYCEADYCKYKGNKGNLDYDDVYIKTVFDWISGITEAKKIGEEVIEDRNTWKVEANNGLMWIDAFYGIPLKIESGGSTYRFQQISANSVKDSDVSFGS